MIVHQPEVVTHSLNVAEGVACLDLHPHCKFGVAYLSFKLKVDGLLHVGKGVHVLHLHTGPVRFAALGPHADVHITPVQWR